MFKYYGAKTNVVKYYPPPTHDTIVEPFAGSARYALRYWKKKVILIDKFDVVVGVWKWLQMSQPEDILKLPRFFMEGQTLDDFRFDCEEAKAFMGFMVKFAPATPALKPSQQKVRARPNYFNFALKGVAAGLEKIRHWDIRHGTYLDAEDIEATWFIDPPYQQGGHAYKHSDISFPELSGWCSKRKGQVIVCEKITADWLPFSPLITQKGAKGMQDEAIWTNFKTSTTSTQYSLF